MTRDSLTTEFLAPFRLGSRVVEATDVAFRLPYEEPKPSPAGATRIGFNVSGLLFNGGYTRQNMFGLAADYPALVRSVLVDFRARPNCEVHLIGHVNSESMPVEDDFRVCELLAAEFPGVVVAPRFQDPSAAKSYIAGMDFFCGSRMHACIAAFSAGVPVLPIAYSRKFAGLFGTLGYGWLADCKTEAADAILHKVVQAFERRDELKAAVEVGRQQADEKLGAYETVLRDAMSRAISRKVDARG